LRVPPPLLPLPLEFLSPQAESVRPRVRTATAGSAIRRREEVFTSVAPESVLLGRLGR